MKDAYGEELNIGDTVVHGLKRSSSIKMTKRTVVAVEEKRVQTEWVERVLDHVRWDTLDGEWVQGAQLRERVFKDVVRRTWIYTPRNVVRVG